MVPEKRKQTDVKSAKLSVVLFGILFALGGVAGIGYGVNTLLDASRMESWPTANALITSSKVRVQRPDGGGSSTYIADVIYQYEVADKVYTSDRVTSARYGTSDSSRAHGQVRKYSVGKTFTAHYDPEDVSYAVLDTRWDRIYALAFAAGAAGLILGVLMLRNAVKG
jgi:hypothetical protein